MKRIALAAVACLTACFDARGEPTAADFLRPPALSRAALSPDGRHVALLTGVESEDLTIYDVESDTRRRLPVSATDAPRLVTPSLSNVRWLGPTRLLAVFNYSTLGTTVYAGTMGPSVPLPAYFQIQADLSRGFSGFAALDLNGKNWRALPGLALRTDSVPDAIEPSFSWDSRRIFVPPKDAGVLFAPAYDGRPGPHPFITRIDTLRGTATRFAKNPGRVTEWIFEYAGRGALGIDASGSTAKLVGPQKPNDKWVELGDLGEPRNRLRFHAFDATRGIVYASRPNPAGRWVLAAFKLKDGGWTEPFGQIEGYDVTPAENRATYAGVELTDILFSPKTGLPLAIGFVSDGPRQQCLDPALTAMQQQLLAAEPDTTTLVIGIDAAETCALTLSWSPRQPGVYSLVDLATHKIVRIGERMPWLRSADLGDTFPLRLKARDGVELDAYVTTPPGSTAKNLPLIVLLREHPWQRDLWGFQPLVQFLATRGYAVLQVNHRGSSGYGEAFLHAGREDLAGVVPNDILDAVHWMVGQGMADPRRIATVGTSFGGTCALLALAREPELFRCGVAINPATDWREIYRAWNETARRYWFDTMGLFPGDRSDARLEAAAPLGSVGRIVAPLLLVHSESDPRSPIRSTKAMAAALKKAGRAPDTFYFDVPRGDRAAMEKKQIEAYERVAAFLARHLAADRATAAVSDAARSLP